jgi:hypothetical protein
MINVRIKPEDTYDGAWDKLLNEVAELDKDSITCRLKEVTLRGDNLEVDGMTLPITGKAEGQLYANLGLEKLGKFLTVIPREEQSEIRERIVRGALKTQEGKALRLMLVTNRDGDREINAVQSTKFAEMPEKEVLATVRDIARPYGTPFRLSYDEEQIFLQFIRPDLVLDLPAESRKQMDRVNGMISVTISPVKTNKIEAGWFQNYCTNGTIFGAETELSITASRTQGLHLQDILPGLFAGIVRRQEQSTAKFDRMLEQTFADRHWIADMFSNSVMKRIFETFVDHKLQEIEAVRGTRFDAWNVITRTAHDAQIEPFKQVEMERIGGRYVMATALN